MPARFSGLTGGPRVSRRRAVGAGAGLTVAPLVPGGILAGSQAATPVATPARDRAATVRAIAEDAMAEMDLRAVLCRVTIDGEDVATLALGESITGVPAAPDMHVRNGAVAISYFATVLLQLVDEGAVSLDDTIERWLPNLPSSDQATWRMLANMTAGYPDYVQSSRFLDDVLREPFRAWTTDDLLGYSLESPRVFAPGTNWDYSHANYVILGLALEAMTGEAVADLLRSRIIEPLGLTGTASEQTARMPDPVLHAYTSERRGFLGIPPDMPFYEEATFWDPSWTISRGAVQYSTIMDMATSMEAIGRGTLLSAASYREQVSDQLIGFGTTLEGCPACHTLDERYTYGLGIVRSGRWLLQNPLLPGYGGTAAYHPGGSIAIAVVTTFGEDSFDETGAHRFGNASQTVFRRIGEALLPNDPPLLG